MFVLAQSSFYRYFSSQGDQLRRLHPEKSLLDKPTEHGIYSLNLKQELLEKLNDKQIKTKESAAVSEPDGSTGLSSRLDRVKITGDADDLLNGNVSAKSDGNGNKTSEKTIVVKDKPSSRSSEVTHCRDSIIMIFQLLLSEE